MVHKHTSVAKLYDILVESSVRYLRLLEATLLKKLDCLDDISLPEVFHFYPENCDHFLTKIYCNGDSTKGLRKFMDVAHVIADIICNYWVPMYDAVIFMA